MNQIITSSIISIIYFLLKFIEMRFIIKQTKPLKDIVKDIILVFLSSNLCLILLEQYNLNDIIGGNLKSSPSVFVSKPDF
tara:strand:+ start:4539 stop:4778 length:240 start_codon:yes stop_codon:yes gene_type:complete